ncbi:MAG: YegP family protein [Mycobacterium sp.]|uniref:YegP family protein n=1 Tax=Mycobacterium sp. TaxID=1785 RepID=UPI003C70D303
MAAKFEVSKDHAGKFRFHLKAPNCEMIIAASQGYETKANAEQGIEAIKTHAPSAAVEDHSGWHLSASVSRAGEVGMAAVSD